MARLTGSDATEQKVIDDVAQFGWHCVNILAEDGLGPYAFTIGLFQTYAHPEFIIFGLPGDVAHKILTIAAEFIRQGRPLDLSAPTDELIDNYPSVFVEVPQTQYYDHVGLCRWYYEGNSFPLYQIVWPSRSGHFPWHPEASAGFRAYQPVLGHVLAGGKAL